MIILFHHFSIEIQYKHLLTLWKNRNWHVKQALSSTEAFTTLKILRKPGAEEVSDAISYCFVMWDALRDLVPFMRFKKRENNHRGVLLLVKFRLKPATLLKVTLPHECFSHFLSCKDGTKSRKASHIKVPILTHR